jgi:hypothetical protein
VKSEERVEKKRGNRSYRRRKRVGRVGCYSREGREEN